MSLLKSSFVQHDKPLTHKLPKTQKHILFRCETMGYGKLEKTNLQ
jgi:hypothetical protein